MVMNDDADDADGDDDDDGACLFYVVCFVCMFCFMWRLRGAVLPHLRALRVRGAGGRRRARRA